MHLRGASGTPGLSTATLTRRDPPRVAFLFTGQGAQYAGMAAGLYAAAPAFREAFDTCDEILGSLLGGSLRELVIESKDAKALEQTALAQPALFAVEYSLGDRSCARSALRLWPCSGIRSANMSLPVSRARSIWRMRCASSRRAAH